MHTDSHTLPLMQTHHIVTVIVPRAVPKMLDYVWGGTHAPVPGDYVSLSVGHSQSHGMVVSCRESAEIGNLKQAEPLNIPPATAATVAFYKWCPQYTLSHPGDALRAGLVSGEVPPKPEPDSELVWQQKFPEKESAARQKVMAVLQKNDTWPNIAELARCADVSDSVVRTLVKQQIISWQPKENIKQHGTPHQPTLSTHQQQAANSLNAALGEFKPFVLDGVMGSGKTEVYFDTIDHLLHTDPTAQILVLVPEISLTPQLTERFNKRFGFDPIVWHTGIQGKARARAWWQTKEGHARVIVGARSALFLPFQHLKFVVVDEEHDSAYKQEEVFRYHGRDMAVSLAHHWQCPVVLCSATPSLESWHNATISGRYHMLHLPSRFGGATLPPIHLIDLKQHTPQAADHYLADISLDALADRLEKGEQSLVFLNRRGMAPLMICRSCGHRYGCPSCDASLVVHHNHLICHHCGFHEPIPTACPACGKEALHAFGPGTRKLKQQLEHRFPNARIAVADSDAITNNTQMATLITRMTHGHIDILIGTQMVTKGHHFPNLTLVVVVDGDMGLAQGELRAAERTFQLLMQVAGRAGRAEKKGEVLLQTHDPQNPLFQHIQRYDRDGFLHLELSHRKTWGDPPYGKQMAFIISGKDEHAVRHAARTLARHFPEKEGCRLLGPAPAPLAKLRDRYRYRLLVKQQKTHQHKHIATWLANTKIPSSVRVMIDVDPQSFY